MYNIKMIATDFDGTFFVHKPGGNDKWYEANLAALRDARKAGILVYPCTGRPWPQTSKLLQPYEFDNLCVVNNGATIMETDSANIYYQQRLSREMAIALFDIATRYKLLMLINSSRYIGFYLPEGNDGGRYVTGHQAATDTEKYSFLIFHALDEMVSYCADNTDLLRVIINPSDISPNLRSELDALTDIEITWSWAYHMDIMAKGVSKGAAVAKLAELKGISLDHVMALGDAENDAPMLKIAGIGVAMGDASQKAIEAADFISDLAENGGFAKAVRKYALNE